MNKVFVTQVIIECIFAAMMGLVFYAGLLYPLPKYLSLMIVFLMFFWRLSAWVSRRNKESKEIPMNVLEEFETVERRWVESGGQIEPTTILWELTKSRNPRLAAIARGESGLEKPVVLVEPGRRQELPNTITPGISSDSSGDNRVKRDNRKSLFGRRVGRK